MRNKLIALTAVFVAFFTKTAAAATNVAGSGCCPLCK